ncbi:MAG: class I SAM-dependent methyltransferase [Actinomycetota bacterium]
MATDDVSPDLIGHYGRGGLLATIDAALVEAGLDPRTVTVDDLGPVDEFHVGGRIATARLVEQLPLGRDPHLLDVGCGLGGTARLLASGPAAAVTGVDLTPEYVAVGRTLTERAGLAERVDLRVGSATALPFDDGTFDGAVMLHVGMNIADKDRLMGEVARVLRPGTVFGVYDLMRVGDGEIRFPVPWSSVEATSCVDRPEVYRQAAEGAGLIVEAQHDRTAEATAFFDRLASGAPGALGLHLVMGPDTSSKVANMVAAVRAGALAPTELLLRRP